MVFGAGERNRVTGAGRDETIEALPQLRDHQLGARGVECLVHLGRRVGELRCRDHPGRLGVVAHPQPFGVEVERVLGTIGDAEPIPLHHVNAVVGEGLLLGRIRRQQPDPGQAQVGQHRRCSVVAARVGGVAEFEIGLQRVEAGVLEGVRLQLLDQPDAAPLVPAGVDEGTVGVLHDRGQGGLQLFTAVAAQRAEGVPGQTLGVDPHPGQHPGRGLVEPDSEGDELDPIDEVAEHGEASMPGGKDGGRDAVDVRQGRIHAPILTSRSRGPATPGRRSGPSIAKIRN